MLQPMQLQEVSVRFAREIAELRDFLEKSGIALNTPQSLSDVASRLQSDRAFHRDLTSYILALNYGIGGPVSYASLLGLLALAAAGQGLAADAPERDAHDLLRFLMEAQQALSGSPGLSVAAGEGPMADALSSSTTASEPPVLLSRTGYRTGRSRRHLGWMAAAIFSLVAISAGVWFLLWQRNDVRQTPQQTSVVTVDRSPKVPSVASVPVTPSPTSGSRRQIVRPLPQVRQGRAPVASSANTSPTPISRASGPGIAMQPSSAAQAPTALANRPASSLHQPNGAIPSSVLSRRLGSPTLPAYAGMQDDAAAIHRRPRLLRRSHAVPSTTTDQDEELVAEMKIPSGIAPGGSVPATPQGIVRPASLGIMAANVVYSPAPAYPAAASAARVQGEVKVQATVDRDGNVASARVISGPPLLRDAALDAVQRWRYRPYMAGGRAISTTALAVVDFELP